MPRSFIIEKKKSWLSKVKEGSSYIYFTDLYIDGSYSYKSSKQISFLTFLFPISNFSIVLLSCAIIGIFSNSALPRTYPANLK
jgi:hypothetical protein